MKTLHPFNLKIGRALAPLMFRRSRKETTGFPASLTMTIEEVEFFRVNGYLVRHCVVPEDMVTRAINYTWKHLPTAFERTVPESWQGVIADSLCERSVSDRKGRVKFRECVRPEKWLHAMIDQNHCIRATVEGFLGTGQVPELPYIRGLYPVLPYHRDRIKVPRPHTDGHRFFVGTLTYLSDVEADSGGFHVWPGSHLLMRKCFETEAGAGWRPEYHRELYLFAKRTPAVEIVAPAGSVVFWHHRLAHAAGINRSSAIRHAVLADYPPRNYAEVCDKPVAPNPWEYWAKPLRL